MGLFSSAKKDSQIGVDFLPDGVAIAQVRSGKKNPGQIMRSTFVEASGQAEQVGALKDWVRSNNLQKSACVCLVANEDFDSYQVEKPEVEESEMIQAVTWKIKDLINYDVAHAVVDSYPMPTSSKNNQQQVGVVAARETVISSYVDGIKSCGLELVALDVHELARANLQTVQDGSEQSLALLSLTRRNGLLSIYQNADLYVNRDFMIGLDQLEQTTSEVESVFDSLLLELQRSLDYYESFYGIGTVRNLRIYPQLPATEKMAMYLQNLTNLDIEFISFDGDEATQGLEPHCFHAYCAALRGVSL